MSENKKLGQEPTYPTSDGNMVYASGMSKRFYAACCAMHGMVVNSYWI